MAHMACKVSDSICSLLGHHSCQIATTLESPCSATGASEVRNIAYMARLGLWGPGTAFASFPDFARAAQRSGRRAMQLMVALELKARGCFVSRTLSYAGAEFEMVRVALGAREARCYAGACELWAQLLVRYLCCCIVIVRRDCGHIGATLWWCVLDRPNSVAGVR